MNLVFYISGAIAVIATAMAITRQNAVHALLYLTASLLAVAVVFYVLGAPFIAALEVIIYAGAIMVLFVFVVMMLNLGNESAEQEDRLLTPGMWIGPSILVAILLAELFYSVSVHVAYSGRQGGSDPQAVGALLFGSYLLAVELASILLMAGLIGAFHLGRTSK